MRGSQFAELSAFAAVAEHRNFTKAAAQLGISPPTLSQTIRALEERLGVRLLNRTTRSVALTEAGERLLGHLQPVLEGLDRAIDAVSSFRDQPAGTLRLMVARAAASVLLAPLIPKFLAEYPGIRLEIAADDTAGDIVRGHFDAGIRIGERIEKDMIVVRVEDAFRILAVAAPDYLARHPRPATPRDLGSHNCIRQRLAWDGVVHPWEFGQDERLQIEVDGSLIVNDTHLVVTAALEGLGIAYIPELAIAPYLADGRLLPLLEDWSRRGSGVFLFYPSRRQVPPALQAFIAFMRRRTSR
jgi:DNA-binding transcriptional LysR family regulator